MSFLWQLHTCIRQILTYGLVCLLSGGALRYVTHGREPYGQGEGPIWMDDLSCDESSNSVEDCGVQWGIHDCGHNEDVALVCQG